MRKKLLLGLLACLSFLWFGTHQQAHAADGAGFTISPALPQNQIDQSTYFNLLVKPGETQRLLIYVKNTTKTAKKLKVSPVSAFTQTNGTIGYYPNDHKDNSAEYTFSQLAGEPKTIDLAGDAQVPVTFDVKIPEKGFTGQILGSLYVEDPTVHKSGGGGMAINNKFAMLIGVVLQTSTTEVAPDLNLMAVKPGSQDNRAGVLATIQNTKPRLFGDMTLDGKVYRQGSDKPYLSRTEKGWSFAPNSHFDYALPSKEALSPGTYTLDLTVRAVGKTWHWRRNFTITRQQSEAIEQKLGREAPQKTWLWIIIAIVLALVILVLLWLVWRQRRKGRETDETKEN
ncbi:DUF916 and DUF3324 domain-containing protein [Lacticaseibacillus rhamnosus]|uniref:DUF916 and DUF3324 domain-containing protein n=1 Tax=Lacticaseibacillus rhamnosus TaxID=47715 RepID=UPI000665A0EE|nr:DUF916 and DUF3324 domain-containing protein [Lacticaseibacillus rhamnosus]WHM90237.1 DUF916 and DUF3324 domain-containing protein [Lacticaseibacillus rhamnosus]